MQVQGKCALIVSSESLWAKSGFILGWIFTTKTLRIEYILFLHLEKNS